MSLSLIFLLAGAALSAGSSITIRSANGAGVRSVSAAALAAGLLMLAIGLVNALSGTT